MNQSHLDHKTSITEICIIHTLWVNADNASESLHRHKNAYEVDAVNNGSKILEVYLKFMPLFIVCAINDQ